MSDEALAALIALHAPLERQGPGDDALLDAMLDALHLPPGPRIAEMGCGSGHTALRLAQSRAARVQAVDIHPALLGSLAKGAVGDGHVAPIEADMMASGIAPGTLDAIVSEGAAYAVGFEAALTAWRPLVRPGGGLVVSECVWWGRERPRQAADFWAQGYPAMGSMGDAVARAEHAGWRLVASVRLPTQAWWDSYYTPLQRRLDALAPGVTAAMRAVIAETRAEIALFTQYHDAYGYALFAFDTVA